ncbi:MAG: UDP-glucose 4-epimerase GalE, partial [Bryobacteraceae bacterium]
VRTIRHVHEGLMKNILVTGGAGYIGSHTTKTLAKQGFKPVVLDNLSMGHRWAARYGSLVVGDLADLDLIRRVLMEYRIDAVLHFAAHAYVGESMLAPERYFRNNVANTLNLVEAMLTCKVRHIVFSSTCATYGVPESTPISESHPQTPVNPYGESKLFVEKVLRWNGQAHGLNSVVLRYFNAAGADPEGELGEDHTPESHLIPLVIEAALGQRRSVDLYGTRYATPDGTAVRDYIHVMDLARAHVLALEYLLAGGESTAFNLGTGRGHSVREVIKCVERIAGGRIRVSEQDSRPGDPAALVAQATRAADILGWRPKFTDLEPIIRTAFSWHASRQPALMATT